MWECLHSQSIMGTSGKIRDVQNGILHNSQDIVGQSFICQTNLWKYQWIHWYFKLSSLPSCYAVIFIPFFTFRCLCTCTLCNDNKLNPIQSNPIQMKFKTSFFLSWEFKLVGRWGGRSADSYIHHAKDGFEVTQQQRWKMESGSLGLYISQTHCIIWT